MSEPKETTHNSRCKRWKNKKLNGAATTIYIMREKNVVRGCCVMEPLAHSHTSAAASRSISRISHVSCSSRRKYYRKNIVESSPLHILFTFSTTHHHHHLHRSLSRSIDGWNEWDFLIQLNLKCIVEHRIGSPGAAYITNLWPQCKCIRLKSV